MTDAAAPEAPVDDEGPDPRRRGLTLFHAADSVDLFSSGTMSFPEFDAGDQAEMADDDTTGSEHVLDGFQDQVLFRGPGPEGFSLVRAWFAPGFVLPRHSHDADCLYYLEQGSIVMGARTLTPGDGFFVPEDAPYAYEAGPEGATVLEFRQRTSFDMKIVGGQVERLRRLNAVAAEQGPRWAELKAART